MQSNNLKLYYCHPCRKSVMIEYPNLVCPECGSDFLQEAKMPEIEEGYTVEVPFRDFVTMFEDQPDVNNRRQRIMARILEGIAQGSVRTLGDILRQVSRRQEASGAATEETIQNIRTVTVEKNESVDCKICADNFSAGEEKQILECSHTFHKSCLLPWLRIKSTCPFCKEPL